jgi:hypothetical protein
MLKKTFFVIAIPQIAGQVPHFCGSGHAKSGNILAALNTFSVFSKLQEASTIYFFFISAQGAETTTQNAR